ncbi:glycerol-3-phosphate dehydrogenase/oxidase [Geobacter anodireducens]|uniref:Glycerol-3-phosphate dehydrogenase/oxidase n=1 Tax=Geobacter anodireducens TaxID=1340425 RepID=A0ABR9NVU4_9BACT|nr:glycerol-3-phosphate dehydrogenase/oxidase [Geobacter anodireducens]MBE2888373.1 glycerol-3-phosphate dehydrogenase/oxidase [Geobacter anodireducens]HMN03616.1 glycerol-3-phosphate dehydrogenase/oxidase [Geobacter anodireducens]
MKREDLLRYLTETEVWDMIVIGGGATGLGTAVEAAGRGYRTFLLEQGDFAQGTSSRSTKLIHGGVRYLQQGNLSLVLEALRERGLLIRNAPHLVHNLSFVVPLYDWWEGPFYGIGLKLYDVLAGTLGLGPSRLLSREETLDHIPTVEPRGLRGGVIYHDGQFDDARLAISLALTLADLGGVALNHFPVTGIISHDGLVAGVEARDRETGRAFRIMGRAVINAAGPFVDGVRRLADPAARDLIAPSQGVHLVLDGSFLPGDSAIMVPHTDDGRVLFAVPWHGRTVVGTTDTPIPAAGLEPRPLPEEIDFLLSHAARYLTRHPERRDVLSTFAGIRPLVRSDGGGTTASLSRDHTLLVEGSGLVTIAGGKWTTYRKMGEDTVTAAAQVAGLDHRPSVTETLRIHGWQEGTADGPLQVYGCDAAALEQLLAENSAWREPLHPALPYRAGEVVWGVRHEWARTVEDVLARRTRALLLDARAAVAAAPRVAELMARELGRDSAWQAAQVAAFTTLAGGYLPE